MTVFTRVIDKVFGRGGHAITVPALDGAFRPNSELDDAEMVLRANRADNLALLGGKAVFSSGNEIRYVEGGNPATFFAAPVACATTLTDGTVAAVTEDSQLHLIGREGETKSLPLPAINCPTAMAAGSDGSLFIANGSAANTPSNWQADLLGKGRSGSVWRMPPGAAHPTKIADRLAWPAGLAVSGDKLVVAESWDSRLVQIGSGGSDPVEVLGNLPGYPSRIAASESGFWLALFAPRNQLVEFVLREDAYRRRMMTEIEPDLWIAPTLRSGLGFLEPLQAGGVKQLGVLKPWAPVLSYGLLAELGSDFIPKRSFHSRADGRRHGVTSCLPVGGSLLFTARGDGVVGKLEQETSA